jgi:hypothetical protein
VSDRGVLGSHDALAQKNYRTTATGYTQVTFTVTGGSAYSLLISTSSDRSSPVALEGALLVRNAYVFSTPDTSNINNVKFWLDNTAMSGSPDRSEGFAPYDYKGRSVSTALAWNTNLVSFTDSTPDETFTATFNLDNNGSNWT